MRERAELIARDLIEYISSIDYQKYYDAMGRPGSRGGDKEKQFSDFSIRAVDAAQVPSLTMLCLLSNPLGLQHIAEEGFMNLYSVIRTGADLSMPTLISLLLPILPALGEKQGTRRKAEESDPTP